MDKFNLKKFLYNNPLYKGQGLTKSDIKQIIKEEWNKMSLREAKEDKADDEELDLEDTDTTDDAKDIDGLEDMNLDSDSEGGDDLSLDSGSGDSGLAPEIEDIQKMLIDLQEKAAALAKNNDNPKDPKYSKFSTQIANTIKYFTADFIADKND